ncbi:D,D-dipeptide ABC transporter permease, partial [Halorubrum ezzemoulense]|nr:D,D-dipeptide ABC transporter permease [Halorubrum ezzemoulense]
MSAESTSVLDRVVSAERRELWQRSWKRFTSRPMSVVGLGIIIAIVLLAVFAPVVAPYPEHAGKFTDFSNTLQPPSVDHPLGTDHVGRDVLSRILFGYRLSLMLVAVVLGFGVPVGVLLGLVAGYYGGWTETIIMRATDTALALPPL